jgi:small subunit ribosomal protein S1
VNHPSEILSIGQTVEVKVLDIDRDRQRISLGLKQTQEDPWQRVVDTYHVGDELEGAVTKVVAFGAFVEILEGVEGLVHISELAQQHVENPREIVAPGDEVKVKILEIDSERRRLSLSIKRVEGQVLPRKTDGLGDAGDLEDMPELGLSEDVFAEHGTVEDDTPEAESAEAEIVDAPVDEDVPVIEAEPVVDAPVEEAPADVAPAFEEAPAPAGEAPAVEEAPVAEAPAEDEAPAPAEEPVAEAEFEKE